jgi:hypothetical protein
VSKISELHFLYAHKKLGSSGATPATLTASAGTMRSAVCAALTEADDYWSGAIVKWLTGGNAGLFSAVKDFTASTDTLTFDEDLPYTVANTDTFMLFHGGKHATDQRVPGMTATTPINVTGFAISHAAMFNGEGTGVLKFRHNGGAGQGLIWTPPGSTEGLEIDISALADGDSATIYGGGGSDSDRAKWVEVSRTAAALPDADAQDDIGLLYPAGTFLPALIGDETFSGVTIYRPVVLKNTSTGKIYALSAYCGTPRESAVATTIASGGGIGTAADTLTGVSLSNWGASGFVYNSAKNDLRYFFNRSGNTAEIQTPLGGIRGFSAVAWDDGDDIELYPWIDIGLDAPGAGSVFEDPASETTAPAGVVFTCPRNAADGLAIGDLAAGAVHCVWERLYIPAGMSPVESGAARLLLYAEVNE